MLTVNQENFDQWLAAMRDPANKQARSALCVIDEEGERAYCCLGLGSMLVPGMEIKEKNEFSETLTFNGMTNLAPFAFIEWLGLDVSAIRPDEDINLEIREYDLMPEWPNGLLTQGTEEQIRRGSGQYSLELSAAAMNDDGFTFNQIADVFERFGIGHIIS